MRVQPPGMTTRDYLLATYLLLNAALAAIDYADTEGTEALDAVFGRLAEDA
jgi:hypothetical protein